MCRWFAYVSPNEPCLLEDILITPKHSLARQVNDHYLPKLIHHEIPHTPEHEIKARNCLLNVDGLGVAYYGPAKADFIPHVAGNRPTLYKTVQPPLNDLNFRSLCANTSSTTVFAHIRAASATAITTVNNHPFVFGRHTIMHNGAISDFLSIRRQLCALLDEDSYANILGSTDSEHLAALYITYLTQGRGKPAWEAEYSTERMAGALDQAIGTIIELQQQILGERRTPNSLNVAITDGYRLLACRFRNHMSEQPPSLYFSTTAGVALNRKYPDHPDGPLGRKQFHLDPEEHGRHVIVASEPSTYKEKEWTLIGKNCVLIVEDDGTGCARKTPYHDAWNARAEGESPPSRGSSIAGSSVGGGDRGSVVGNPERGSLISLRSERSENGLGKGKGNIR